MFFVSSISEPNRTSSFDFVRFCSILFRNRTQIQNKECRARRVHEIETLNYKEKICLWTITNVQRNHIFAGPLLPGVKSFKMNDALRRNSEYENMKQNFWWSCLSRLDVRIYHQEFENRKFDSCSLHIFWWVPYRLVIEPNRTFDFVRFVFDFFVSSILFYDRTKSNLMALNSRGIVLLNWQKCIAWLDLNCEKITKFSMV